MKKILLSIAAVAALGAAAVPAAAQPWSHGRYADSQLTSSYVDSLDWKINNAARQGRISWGEARDLRTQLRQVQPIAYRVQTGQARGWETRRLQVAVDRIEQAVNSYGPSYGPSYGYRR
jgi:hypothetical protein